MLKLGALSLLVVALGALGGCASLDEPLWYKPGGVYTTAEFKRDQEACTRDKKLDAECMKAKGWVAVSPDRPASTQAPTPPSRPRPGRY